MGTKDNIYDLLGMLEKQNLDYHLIILEDDNKKNHKNMHIYTSLDEDNQSELLKFIKLSSKKQKNKNT